MPCAVLPPTVRAAVKALANEIGEVCEAREEEILKESMPGAQRYVAELEAYRLAIVSDRALRATCAGTGRDCSEGASGESSVGRHREATGERRHSVEVDEDLWRLFGAMETRLYSSAAALGKKPGKLFVTFSTLWFHSKVRETRDVRCPAQCSLLMGATCTFCVQALSPETVPASFCIVTILQCDFARVWSASSQSHSGTT